jgi:predicted acylesterase/phospholipase RssA
MKKIAVTLSLLLFLAIAISFRSKREVPVQNSNYPKPRNGVALIMTGAAARIPQEAALLEELDRRGLLKNLVFISGVSSGALNSVMLNGILSGKMSWDEYKTILFNLKNKNIFVREGRKLPVNTSPSRELYKSLVEDKLGYFKIGNLPITTAISFTHLKDLDLKKTVYRMCSRKINQETDTTLNLVDIMMATSAFPLVFPPVRIRNVKTIPDYEYVDGGVGEDHVPYHALLEFEKFRGAGVEKVYVISRMSDSIPDFSEELKDIGINDKGIFDKLGFSFDAMLYKGIVKRLEAFANESPELVPRTFIWIPNLKANFMLFNFDHLKEQYTLTSQWAKSHDPEPMSDFLSKYLIRKR